jgi:hypothetical protein
VPNTLPAAIEAQADQTCLAFARNVGQRVCLHTYKEHRRLAHRLQSAREKNPLSRCDPGVFSLHPVSTCRLGGVFVCILNVLSFISVQR